MSSEEEASELRKLLHHAQARLDEYERLTKILDDLLIGASQHNPKPDLAVCLDNVQHLHQREVRVSAALGELLTAAKEGGPTPQLLAFAQEVYDGE